MLESLVAWVLNNYLGKYVENLNTDQLSIALLTGEVELENLPLRKDALRHFGVPIEIKAGYIGKVKLKIPIRSLRSSPWVINLSGLVLITGLINLEEWDQTAEDLAEQERKLASLDALEAAWRVESDQNPFLSSHYASSYSTWLQFGTGLITDIVENMQLNIKDVHFRFENSEISSVCGLKIECISAQSCDENFVPQYSSGSEISFKKIELKNLAVYWDNSNVSNLNLPISDLVKLLSEINPESHCYVLAPVSACAKLQRNRNELPLRSVNKPRIICDLNLDQVPLTVIDWQYQQMITCLQTLNFLSRVQQYRRHRPSVSISTDPKAWWGYAVLCHVPGALRQRPTWSEALERARQNVQYVEMYARLLMQPSAALSSEEKKLKDEVEWSRDFLELRALREVSMRRCPFPPSSPISSPIVSPQSGPPIASQDPPSQQSTSQGRSLLVRWFPQWWGWYSPPSAPQGGQGDGGEVGGLPEVSPPQNRQLEDEILEALADSAKNNTILRRDTVFGRFHFSLNGGMMELRASQIVGEKGVTMLDLQFSDLFASIISKPRSSSFSVELRLGVLELRDRLTTGTLFPVLVGPPNVDPSPLVSTQRSNFRQRMRQDLPSPHPFFTLEYSFSNSINRLTVTSLPLDVVYHPQAARWLLDFISSPHHNSTTRTRLEAVRARTKQLTDTWGRHMLERDRENIWEIRLDISAPQIIIVEKITDPNSAIAVVDLGTLLLKNTPDLKIQKQTSESEDESENFMTPCSTPPGSQASLDENKTLISSLNEQSLHQRLYDTYNIELNDIQILVGKIRDNWRHAHTKGSSNLHVLDRFNIFLTLEKRVVPTNDPSYPNLTLNANLPRLVAHINEQKISSIRNLLKIITDSNIDSPFQSSPKHESEPLIELEEEEKSNEVTEVRLVTLQFTVDQMSLEVQSRGRSVAELQVSGISLSLIHSPPTLHLSLSILSLLLVDALQTLGPGFELLVASHRLVVMDSTSGEIKDSEPCSPTSPGSPTGFPKQQGSPEQIARALEASGLQNEVLIYGEYTIDRTNDGIVQVASVRFSNLDIIANQETIVELMGFVRRVFPKKPSRVQIPPPIPIDDDLTSKLSKTPSENSLSSDSIDLKSKIELNFDFHRLNVLLLRGSMEDGRIIGRKIATMTMSDAKIEVTIDKEVFIRGSLGGLQILDLIGKSLHQRIISVGKDPLADEFQTKFNDTNRNFKHFFDLNDQTAFKFQIKRSLCSNSPLILTCHLASVWYTHSQLFLGELHSCAAEFKQYLADLARSIRSAATDVALGLVHSRTELLAQTLYAKTGMVDIQSPRKRRRSGSFGFGSEGPTPFSPDDEEDSFTSTDIELDIILDSPVLVLPRSSTNHHVLVGHLGKITINNTPDAYNTYNIEIKDMSICTLDTSITRSEDSVQRVQSLYNCSTGLPILHDTVLRLKVVKNNFPQLVNKEGEFLGVDIKEDFDLNITGNVINDLRVTLTRGQYEQLLDTLQWLANENQQNLNSEPMGMTSIPENDAMGVSTLSMDPHMRAKLFPSANRRRINTEETFLKIGVKFSVASFGVELCSQEHEGLVGLSFGEFLLSYTTHKKWETELQVSLRSLLVEDLLSEKGSFGRQIITSRCDTDFSPLIPPCISKSFPESDSYSNFQKFASLPDHLDTREIFGLKTPKLTPQRAVKPPRINQRSRGQDLVLVTSKFVDPLSPNFKTEYDEIKKATTVDLGSIDVVISPKSWIPLLEFFRVTNQDEDIKIALTQEDKKHNSTTSINFNSLTIQILHNFSNIARAKISGAHLDIFRKGPTREFQGHLGALQIRHPGKENFSCRGEKFVTIGEKSLDFSLKIENNQSELNLEISPFVYVHTKRFIAEIKAFLRAFQNENSTSTKKQQNLSKMNFKISTNSCITLFPISVTSSNLLVLEISKLEASNMSEQAPESVEMDISKWFLFEVDFYTALATERPLLVNLNPIEIQEIIFGDCCVRRTSSSLLKEKGMLEIRVDRSMLPDYRKNNVPDMIINCQLSTLEIFLNMQEYALIRGVLSQNFGEDTEHILATYIPTNFDQDQNFILSSIRIELLDVKLHLKDLTCINFIKSRLVVDSYSDLKQDIDLVSRQILITDARQEKLNIYEEILKPIKNSNDVQCEIHSRKCIDRSKFTVLLNNMRLLAITNWWLLANDFIFTNFDFPDNSEKISVENTQKNEVPFELKLNITESEIVVLEDFSKDDTNAVILRSTTLVTYKPNHSTVDFKPLQVSVNHLELFSCRFLSSQSNQMLLEETALSIIDPVTISAEVSRQILEIHLHELTIRVSYRDMLLFGAILDSFRRQTVRNKPPNSMEIFSKDVEKLKSLGFTESDCLTALKICKQLDDAALWLTQNAVAKNIPTAPKNGLDIAKIELNSSILRFCLIDDCANVDVPLLEVCIKNLTLSYEIGTQESSQEPNLGFQMVESTLGGPKTTTIEGTLSLDYYNRILGGWEPFLEPWKCKAIWKPENTLTTSRNKVALNSNDILDLNITDSFLNLVKHVKESWINDFQGPKSNPRSPFVPYSLRNDTGSILYFATVVSDPDDSVRSIDHGQFDFEKHKNLKWIEVQPGATLAFSYHSSHSKQRHAESHQLRTHQLCVRVCGWQPCFPVSVDQVGVSFRSANPDRGAEPHRVTAPRAARLVFEVRLEGGARKLVVVTRVVRERKVVQPGATLAFSYHSSHSKQRHAESHQLRTHQLCVRVCGWQPCFPVTVDQVGVSFRSANPDRGAEPHRVTAPRAARLVFEVQPGATLAFSYHSSHSKQRHAESHQLRTHQLCVRVCGWQPCFPVTVDQVGVSFRSANPDRGAEPHRVTAPRAARLVFEVQPGATLAFSYHSSHSKQRHAESHQLRTHQLCVRVCGWQPCFPVSVDQVGVSFRSANPDRGAEPHRVTAPRAARLVFEVRLEGSARKLVVVRSAMVLVNRLKDAVDVKLVERSAVNAVSTSSRTAILNPLDHFSLPLIHCHSHIFVRPSSENFFSYSQPDIPWSRITRPNERAFFPLRCTTNRGAPYYLCCEIKREKYPIGDVGHTIILIPMILLVNYLPQDLFYSITSFCDSEVNVISKGRILPGQNINISAADPDMNLEINFWIENFKCVSGLNINGNQQGLNSEAIMDYTTRIRLQDSNSRPLYLTSRIETWCSARLRVSCWSPWLLRTRAGLPIILKAGGVILAGQSSDHELARALAPLPFSLEDEQGGVALTARIGTRYMQGSPQDCAPFHLRRGTQVRRLRVVRNKEQGQQDAVFVLSIEVKPRPITSLVTISPRHQLCNKSSYWLEFAQQCDVENEGLNRVCAPPGCYLPFHFPHLDSPLLISLRLISPPPHKSLTLWSGGIRLEIPQSYHLPLFEPSVGLCPTRWGFLHAEVTPQGPSLCLVVSEAGALPPELRIDNHSEVAVLVRQQCEARQSRALQNGAQTVHARASVPYAWPEPCGAHCLLIEGPGGETVSVDLKKMEAVTLAYENFNYLAFTGTFNTDDDLDQYDETAYSLNSIQSRHKNVKPQLDPVRNQRLVLDVPEGSTDVILAKKQPGKRSQLFRVTTSGLLEHIASSTSSSLVLDIGALSPRPSAPPPKLALRRPDPRRRSTQTWRFSSDGRLCCAHRNTCVQSPDGILGLRPGSYAVLGPTRDCPSYRDVPDSPNANAPGPSYPNANALGSSLPNANALGSSVPIEQCVGKQKMRPGSGLLSIDVTTDGPTRVVRIKDLKISELSTLGCFEEDWKGVAPLHRPIVANIENITEWQFTFMLRSGLGISFIGGKRELLYLQLNNIIAEAIFAANSQEFCVSVQDSQIDNQISNQYPVLLYASRVRSHSEQKRVQNLPVLELRAVLTPSTGHVLIFKHLIVCLRPLSIHLEETLILRMYEFFLTALGERIDLEDTEGSKLDEDLSDLTVTTPQQNLDPVLRYHFGIIRLVPGPIRLSVHTANSGTLTPRLRGLKRRLGLTLVGFEDAPVELEPYVRHLPFETAQRLVESIVEHFRDELMWQAATILGSVDFLGSPLGLLGDVSEGVSGLIRERSVGALVLNVAHGLSNSAAKVTETLGDGLGRVAMDESHEEMRQRIRRRGGTSSSGGHIVAGLKGLGFGVLGGATGIFKQVYEGASTDGLQGVFSGLGKGLVGAVAKPVVGVLDLATETARAVRDSSRGSGRTIPSRRRPVRSTLGPGGLLPLYNPKDSLGQAYLQELLKPIHNDTELQNREFYVSYESVRSGSDDLRVIVSSERVYVVTGSNPEQSEKKLTIVTETRLNELVKCSNVTQQGKFYIEMTVKGQSMRRPLIRCDSEDISRSVTRQINYAKRLYEEATHTLQSQDD